ncbi:putative membrane protein [Saccharococcus thermophilus]|uniref:Putative membrane protein n=1 Tax=Saccharococcus thermophilus TaxID=29396 RepID=A0A846MDM0_9BACL|nr:putative membrane protein [Saccharococcus thermophilus]
MMKLRMNILILSVVLLVFPMNTLANEVHYEDKDTPISFMIEVLP